MTEMVSSSGEIIAVGAALTPAQARDRATWVREMRRAVLVAGTDYGQIPGTDGTSLLKPGAEMLLLAAGYGFTMQKIDDLDAREHQGVTYKASVQRDTGAGAVTVAECEGFAGYDESRFYRPADGNKPEYRAPWNTLVKMAQKRALVGATKSACAASGLFTADDPDDQATGSARGRRSSSPGRSSPTAGAMRAAAPSTEPARNPTPSEAVSMVAGADALEHRLNAMPESARHAFRDWRRSRGFDWPPSTLEVVAQMVHELEALEDAAAEDRETYPDTP
jgi:hypothetical protein